MKKLRDELTRALMEANDGDVNEGAGSFNELVKEMTSKQDLKAFAFKTKAMVNKKKFTVLLLVTLYGDELMIMMFCFPLFLVIACCLDQCVHFRSENQEMPTHLN